MTFGEQANGHDEEREAVADLTPPKGLSSAAFMVETWREAKKGQLDAKAARKAAETAGTHALAANQAVGELMGEIGALGRKVDDLGGSVRRATVRPPSILPMRHEEPSGVNLERFADKLVKAAVEGERTPGKTPEDMTRAIVADEQERLAEKALVRGVLERRRRIRATLWAAAAVIAGDGGIELLKWLAAHHG